MCDKNTQHNHQCVAIASNIPVIPDELHEENNDDDTITIEASVVEDTSISDSRSSHDDVLLADNALVVGNSSDIVTNATSTASAMVPVNDECSDPKNDECNDMPIQQPAPEFDAVVRMLRDIYFQQNEVERLQMIDALTALTTFCGVHDAIATPSANNSITLQLLHKSGKHVCVHITY